MKRLLRFVFRRLLPLAILLGIGGFFIFAPAIAERGMNGVKPHAPYPVSEEAAALHRTLTVGDLHADSLLWNRNLLNRSDQGHVDFPRLREGNVGFQVFTAVTKSPAGLNYEENSSDARDNITILAIGQLWPFKSWFDLTERGLYQAHRLARYEDESPETLRRLLSAQDVKDVLAARKSGAPLIGGLMGAEGGHVLGGKIENLGKLYDAGYRLMGLTHFFDNELGGSLHGTDGGSGLTDFGRAVVAEMDARGMIIDLAHTSPAMAREALSLTTRPVIVSHTGIYSHCQTHRNFEDDLIREIAAKGGLIGIGFWDEVTCDATPMGIAKTIKAAVDLVGVQNVALGSDYDGAVTVEMTSNELPALTHALLEIGMTPSQIRAVMGGNMARFLLANLPQ